MSLVELPKPRTPSLTVKALAALMVQPASALATEIQNHKYPREGAAAHRVPYYQSATNTLARFLQQDGDIRVLDEAVADLERRLTAAVEQGDASNQLEVKLKNNLRVLEDAARFKALRDALAAERGATTTFEVQGFKLRSTPELLVRFKNEERRVFLHFPATAIDQDEARRVLELALWVEQRGGNSDLEMKHFEYWDLAANLVHRWPRARKGTVKKALDTLSVLQSVWQASPAPRRGLAARAAGNAS